MPVASPQLTRSPKPLHERAWESDFAKLDALRDADLAPLWDAYAEARFDRSVRYGHPNYGQRKAHRALVDAGVPDAAVWEWERELTAARANGRPRPAPTWSAEAEADKERARLLREDPRGLTPDGWAALSSAALKASRVIAQEAAKSKAEAEAARAVEAQEAAPQEPQAEPWAPSLKEQREAIRARRRVEAFAQASHVPHTPEQIELMAHGSPVLREGERRALAWIDAQNERTDP